MGEMDEGHSYELFVCSDSMGSIYFIVGTTFKIGLCYSSLRISRLLSAFSRITLPLASW